MGSKIFNQFVLSVLILGLVGHALVTVVTPPDPLTALYGFFLVFPVVIVASYVLSYRIGFEWF